MLAMYDFTVVQVRYVRAAMLELPSYRPDGKTPAEVLTLIDSATAPRTEYVVKRTALTGAQADRRAGIKSLHDVCVLFRAQALITYRAQPALVERIERLPVDDNNFQETLVRAAATRELWSVLPDVGTPPVPFALRQVDSSFEVTAFADDIDALEATLATLPETDQDFQKAEADIHAKQRELEEFVSAALAQGVSQFAEGTVGRELIDAIPNAPPQQVPGQAVITNSSQPDPDAAHLEYDAPGATTYEILQKGPGEPLFSVVLENLIEREADLTGLAPGDYEFKVRPRNSRGAGPDSEAVAFTVLP